MSFDKSAIEEANKHLQALSQRVLELNAVVKQQAEQLENIEAENQGRIQAIVHQKDAEIEKRNAWLESTQAEIRRLNIEVINKDVTISQLTTKAAILDKAFRYKPELEGLLNCLTEAETVRAAASGSTSARKTPTPKPSVSHTMSSSSVQTENRKIDEGSSDSSLSEEDFSETEQSNVIWTPKAKIQPDQENMQNLSLNGRRGYATPSKVPGGATVVKHEEDTATPMDAETEQISKNTSNDPTETSPTILANYETQL